MYEQLEEVEQKMDLLLQIVQAGKTPERSQRRGYIVRQKMVDLTYGKPHGNRSTEQTTQFSL